MHYNNNNNIISTYYPGYTTLYRDPIDVNKVHVYFYPGYDHKWRPVLKIDMKTIEYTYTKNGYTGALDFVFDTSEVRNVSFTVRSSNAIKSFDIDLSKIKSN